MTAEIIHHPNQGPLPGPLTPAQCQAIAAQAGIYAAHIDRGLSPEIKAAVIAGALLGYYLGRMEGGAL